MTEAPRANAADVLLAALALPPSVRVDQRVPKKLLLEHGAPTPADRRLVQDGLDAILWTAVLKPATVGRAAYRDAVRDYAEIAVLTVALRPAVRPAQAARVAELVHRAVPYPVALVLAQGDAATLSLAQKRRRREGGDGSEAVVAELPGASATLGAAPAPGSVEAAFLAAIALGTAPAADLFALYAGWAVLAPSEETGVVLPDILTVLQDATQLTRRTLARILVESERLDDFRRNPQHFLEIATESINRTKRLALVSGIRYQRIGDDEYYAQELFEQRELIGYMKNTVPSTRSPYDYVVYDSETVELPFAEKLEGNDAVKVYAKLPKWFTVPTPLGTYNPDWALLVERDGAELLYLVVETKGSQYVDDLRSSEGAKIECGKAHFRALSVGERPAEYRVERSFDEMMASL